MLLCLAEEGVTSREKRAWQTVDPRRACRRRLIFQQEGFSRHAEASSLWGWLTIGMLNLDNVGA